MRLATTAAFTVLLVQAAAGPAQQQRPLPGAIQGVVLQAGSGDPTPAVPPLPVATIPPVITGADGKFAFTDLEPVPGGRTTAGNTGSFGSLRDGITWR